MAGLLVVEIGLRVLVPKPFLGYQYDESSGTGLIPGSEGWWTVEGVNYIRINAAGSNDDREYSVEKTPGTYRVVVLGDSYVEALQVAPGESFSRVLEGRLNEECQVEGVRTFEILQFGVSGHGAPQYWQTWLSRAREFQPDLVLALITTGNDFRNAVEELEGDSGRPYFVARNGDFEWDMSFRDESPLNPELHVWARIRPWVLDASRTVAVAWESLRRIRDTVRAGSQPQDALMGDNTIYRPYEQLSSSWQQGYLATLAAIDALESGTEDAGSEFLAVIGTNDPQVHPSASVRAQLAIRLGVTDLDGPSRWLTRELAKAGVPYVDLVPELRAEAEATGIGMHGQPPDWGGHWNAVGHQVVAFELAPQVCRQAGGSWLGE